MNTTALTDEQITSLVTALFPRWREDIQERFVLEVARAVIASAPQPSPPKPLDDPALQELFSSAISGALAFGAQGVNQPPAGHWLTQFWNMGAALTTPPQGAYSLLPGWKLVPVEPTEEMVRTACDCQEADPEDGLEAEMHHVYRAMVSASPLPAPQEPAEAPGLTMPAAMADKPDLKDSLREVSKWLNEQPNRPVDRQALAKLCSFIQIALERDEAMDASFALYAAPAPADERPTDAAGQSSIDIEKMLAECVPGGQSCDPQQVADNIRRYCDTWPRLHQGAAG